MINNYVTLGQEPKITLDKDFPNTETDLTIDNLLEDYLAYEPEQKQSKQLEQIYNQAERSKNIAIAMGEYDYQRGLKPDRRLAANQWYRFGFNKAYWQSIFALYGIEAEKFNN